MKKLFLLAAVGLSLLALSGHSVFSPGRSVAASAVQEVTPTPTATREPVPVPSLITDQVATLVNDLDGDGVIDPGDTVKCIITYENTGEADATKVTIVDDYDQSLIASIANISGKGKDDGDTIIWELGTVEAGAGDTVTYEATLKDALPPGSISIETTVTVASNETGSSSTTNIILVKGPRLTVLKERKLVKDLDADETIDPGDTIKYIITYENTGEIDATKVTIVDDYDQAHIAGISSISGKGKEDGDTIIWALGTVEAGAGGSVTYEATLKDTFPPGSISIENTVTIASAEMEPASDEASIMVEVAPTPTPEPTPTPTPMPEPTSVPDEVGPAGGLFSTRPEIPSLLIGFLVLAITCVLVYVGAFAKYRSDDEAKTLELGKLRITMVREGIILIFIVSAILILAMGGGIKQDGAISILSAIVGYLFGRETARSE